MVRTLITIDDKELAKLDRLAKKQKKSRAQLMREAVSQYLERKAKEPTWKELVSQTAGIWKDRNVDGLEYERKLREEWNR